MSPTVICTRNGCGKPFDPSSPEASAATCTFHPGGPIFHEGLKSWSCCKDVNKPVHDFDEFQKIPGCATGSHSSEGAPAATSRSDISNTNVIGSSLPPASAFKAPASSDSKTTYGNGKPVASGGSSTLPIAPVRKPTEVAPTAENPPVVEEQDDPAVPIPKGAKCKRRGCDGVFDEGMERKDDECLYHFGVPIFHEGSKGYSCCKPKVLEFDEFLKIPGCKHGRHLFVGSIKPAEVSEAVTLRTDHYQTPKQVIVSVFGKGADKTKSTVRFAEQEMLVELFLPQSKTFSKSFPLYGPIIPESCSFKILGTKCEVILTKADARSWPALEDDELLKNGGFIPQLTFGVGGRTGTVGGKEMILDPVNQQGLQS